MVVVIKKYILRDVWEHEDVYDKKCDGQYHHS